MSYAEESPSGLSSIFMIVLGLPLAIWKAFVITKLWGWFLVQHFKFEELTMVPAIGICLTVGLLTYSMPKSDIKNEDLWVAVFVSAFMPLSMLFSGWLLQAFYT